MKHDEWDHLFGDPPATFAHRVEATVRRMEQKPNPRIRPRTVALLAAILLLLFGTALALSSLGVLDTLSKTLREALSPEAGRLVQTLPAQSGKQPDFACFTVEEAINDGYQLYVTVRVAPMDKDKTMLMDLNADPSTGMDWWIANDFQAGETFSAAAAKTGQTLVRAVCSLEKDEEPLQLLDYTVHYDGEDILYAFTYPSPEAEDFEGELELFTHDLYAQEDTRSWGELSLSIPFTKESKHYTSEAPVPLPIAGLVIQQCNVRQTPIATYLELIYGPTPEATDIQHLNFKDGIWCRWLNEKGQVIREGNSAGSLEPMEDGSVRYHAAYPANMELSQGVTLEFYSGMSKERFDTIHISLDGGEQR